MSNLQRYDNDGFELVINTVTGESFATVSGYARMVGLTKQAISKRLGTVNPETTKTAEILTQTGYKKATLIPENLIAKWIVRDNPELATKMLLRGVRKYLHSTVNHGNSDNTVSEVGLDGLEFPPSLHNGECYVYIFEDAVNRVIKVGISNNLVQRHIALENGSGRSLDLMYWALYPTRKQANLIELGIHNNLNKYRTKGEWFDIDFESALKLTGGLTLL